MEKNIFEEATKQRVRFDTQRGVSTIEDVWLMPLTSKTGFDLDTLAKIINIDLRTMSEESFVKTNTNPLKPMAELKMALVKHIIAVKLEENALRLARSEKAEKRAKLIELLGKKQDEAMGALSEEDIKKQLAALDE